MSPHGTSRAGKGSDRRPSTRSIRPRRCRVSVRRRPTSTRRERSPSTPAPRPVTRVTAGPTALTFHDYHDTDGLYRLPPHRLRRRSSTCRSCATPGCSRCTAISSWPTRRDDQIDSVLHAAVARRRLVAARLLELALSRSEQPAAAGRVARLANRFLDMAVFYDAGRVAARRSDLTSAPLKSDYGLGFRFHGAMMTPLRIEFVHEQRRVQPRILVEGGVLIVTRTCAVPPLALALAVGARGVRAPARVSTPTIRWRASRRAATRGKRSAGRHRSALRHFATTCSSRRRANPSNTRARNVNTIDEVPDSSWFTNRILPRTVLGRRSRARAHTGAARPNPERWVISREKSAGASPGLHGE